MWAKRRGGGAVNTQIQILENGKHSLAIWELIIEGVNPPNLSHLSKQLQASLPTGTE